MKRIFRVTTLPAWISLIVVSVIWLFVEAQNRSVHDKQMREDVLSRASILRAQIEGELASNIQLIRGLVATLSTEPDMDSVRFKALASGLTTEHGVIRNIAAAPDMVIRHVYPFEENAAAIDLDYMTHPTQRDAAVMARDTGRLVIAGPVSLIQGGHGIVGRFPVFIPDGAGETRFWGLVSVVIDADGFYAQTGLLEPDLQMQIALRGHDGQGAEGDIFFGDPTIETREPVKLPVALPHGAWQLLALPEDGWQRHPPNQWQLRLWLATGAALIILPSIFMGRLLDERARYGARQQFALQEQRAANDRFEKVSRISRTFIWEQDADHRLSYLSSGYDYITGYRGAKLLGARITELVRENPEVRSSADWPALQKTLDQHQPFSDFICLATTREGEEMWLQLSGSPVFDATGRFLGYRGAGMDVTGLQRTRQAADAANRMKSMFLANMSHEIRTPLNGVLGMAQALRGAITDPEHLHMVMTIQESGQNLQNILNDILDLSKIEAGKLDLQDAPFQPEDTLKRVCDLHRMRAEEKGLTLDVSGLSPPGRARLGDVHRFAQILHNLIGNATKFTESGGVTVEMTNHQGQALSVRIADTGPGMSDTQLPRLFDEFVQGDGSVARRHGGTGLGMSIVQRLVNLMQGSLDVRSRQGEGTVITVTLPLPVCDMPGPQISEADSERDIAGLRVLAADDNRTNQLVLKALLRNSGIQLTLVADGQEAIDAWREGRFDILLLDISMPVLGGIEALRLMREEAQRTGRHLPPAVAFTANVMAHQISEYLREGFVSCVGKPLQKSVLIDALKAAHQPETVPSLD